MRRKKEKKRKRKKIKENNPLNYSKERKKIVKTCLFTLFFLICLTSCIYKVAAQDNHAVEIHKLVLADWESKYPKSKIPLLIQNLPKLNEDIIGLQLSNDPPFKTGLRKMNFYGVTNGIYELEGSNLVKESFLLRNEAPYWTIAVDASGEFYELKGFSEPRTDFNRLITTLKLNISDADAAEAAFYLYLNTCRENAPDSFLVSDAMSLQYMAIRDFRIRYTSGRNQAEYDRWWKSLSSKVKKELSPPEVSRNENAFTITFFSYYHGGIFKESIMLNKAGIILSDKSIRLN